MVVAVRPDHSGARSVPSVDLVAPANMGPRRPRGFNLSRHLQRTGIGSLIAWRLDVDVKNAAGCSNARAPVVSGSGVAIGVRLLTRVVCADNRRVLRTRTSEAWLACDARR